MTIGSSHDHPASLIDPAQTSPLPWAARFPNPPDLCFDYRRLLEQAGGVARANMLEHRICIVGAGVTGLTAARELVRCGFRNVTLIEQAKRVGGRHLTIRPSSELDTPFEMGAMRMPFFNRSGEPPQSGHSLLAYYAEQFELRLSPFPNPGTPAVNATGIYLREGLLEDTDDPTLLIWRNASGAEPPPSQRLQAVYEKWQRFAKRFATEIAKVYGSAEWPEFWRAIVDRYHLLSFRDLVHLEASHRQTIKGDFGGLGMSEEESSIFYAIGIGDGSWGAFYDVCCLYPLRTALFGFSSHLQLVHGRVDERGMPLPGPHVGSESLPDSRGLLFEGPHYQGIAALDECLLLMPIDTTGTSLYEHCVARPEGLLTDSSVRAITRLASGHIRVDYQWRQEEAEESEACSGLFDSVIVTLPSWLIETRLQLNGFDAASLPPRMVEAWKHAHWETSCKVYAPLDKAFLRSHGNIPQILVTDSFIHDVYAYRYNETYPHDCILLSYTWEDDATKLGSLDSSELVDRCVQELDRILLRCSNVAQPISPFIDIEHARVQRWMADPNALGCAKLYRAGTYYDAVSLMKYNRDYSARSGLYLAGESFSVDAGWTEPCLRTAIDAVINICDRTGAEFNGSFTMADYPHYYVPERAN